MTISDNEYSSQLIFPFFRIREEATTKHPKEHSLNLEEEREEGY